LRQYPYSLEVTGPPPNVDPVAYFLFELQAGYCDYYASAMVVMARSLGLPARMGVGYLAQPADEAGVQTIRQLHGHSWAEIYFAGVGWVEFEPTGSFDSPRDARGTSAAGVAEGTEVESAAAAAADSGFGADAAVPVAACVAYRRAGIGLVRWCGGGSSGGWRRRGGRTRWGLRTAVCRSGRAVSAIRFPRRRRRTNLPPGSAAG
jgi:transglutaminase-like putative cysteine protease